MTLINKNEEKKLLSVSVIISVYNRHEYLEEALESLMRQTLLPDEIIIVNDGSTRAETLECLNSIESRFPVRIISIENSGLAAARNVGRSVAHSDILVFLDDDDIFGENYLQKTVGFLSSHDSYAVAYTEAELFGESNGAWLLPMYDARKIIIENMVYASAAVRATTFDEVGGYDEALRNGREDHDLWIRITATGAKFKRLSGCEFFYRQTLGSMNHSVGESAQSLAALYAHISRNSPEYYLKNIDVLWEEIFMGMEEIKRYRRIYGPVDNVRKKFGKNARKIKHHLAKIALQRARR